MRAYEDRVDYYAVLNVPRDATPSQIRMSYKQLVRSEHPDKKRQGYDSQVFKNILKAYSILKDIKSRSEYDRQTGGGGAFKKSFSFRFAYDSLIKGTYRFFNTMNIRFLDAHTEKNSPDTEDYYDKEYGYYISDKLLEMEIPEIIQRLCYSDNKYVRISAVVLLAYKKEAVLKDRLDDLLAHRDSDLRKAAIWAAGKMGLAIKLRDLRNVSHLYTPEEQFILLKAVCFVSGGRDRTILADLDALVEKNIKLEKGVNELKQVYKLA